MDQMSFNRRVVKQTMAHSRSSGVLLSSEKEQMIDGLGHSDKTPGNDGAGVSQCQKVKHDIHMQWNITQPLKRMG